MRSIASPLLRLGRIHPRLFTTHFDPAKELGSTAKTVDGASQLYDRWAPTYDETLKSWGYEAPQRCAKILDKLVVDKTLPLLDSGCGTGLVGAELQRLGFGNIHGSDVSKESIKHVTLHKPNVYTDLRECDLTKVLPYSTNSFQAACCVGVLSYIHDFDTLFREWVRCVRPKGFVVFTHNAQFWEDDLDDVQTIADTLNNEGLWTVHEISKPQDYMPQNPVKEERDKRIRYFAFQVAKEQGEDAS